MYVTMQDLHVCNLYDITTAILGIPRENGRAQLDLLRVEDPGEYSEASYNQ